MTKVDVTVDLILRNNIKQEIMNHKKRQAVQSDGIPKFCKECGLPLVVTKLEGYRYDEFSGVREILCLVQCQNIEEENKRISEENLRAYKKRDDGEFVFLTPYGHTNRKIWVVDTHIEE